MSPRPLINRFYQVLSSSELEMIHQASINVLGKTGIQMDDEEAIRILVSAGAKLRGKSLIIPEDLVLDAIERCPQKFVLHARDKKYDLEIGNGMIYYTNGFGATMTEDLDSGRYRPSNIEDLRKYIRLADSLDNVHYCLHQVFPGDVPSSLADAYQASITLTNTRKNVHLSVESGVNVDLILEIAQIASENIPNERRPIFSSGATPTTPLHYDRGACQRLIKFAKAGVPVFIVSGAMAGGSAPVTLAGTLTVQNAEVLAGMLLVQLIAPGNPTVYGSFSGPMNMRTGKYLLGAPEMALMNAATAQLCRHYKIPFAYGTGGISDSPVSDFQAGAEKASTVLSAALAGVEVIHDGCSGILDGGLIASYSQMVIDNELCNYINRILRGIDVSVDTIAEELIATIGAEGNFLSEEHTFKHFRKEHHFPLLFQWCEKPKHVFDNLDYVLNEARQIAKENIESNNEEIVTKEQNKEIEKVLGKIKK